jgi:hypothetical protein
VSPSLIYQWCEQRVLTHFRVGGKGRRGRILIDPADLDALLLARRVEAGIPTGSFAFTHRRP